MHSLRLGIASLILLLLGSLVFVGCGNDDNPVNAGIPISKVYLEFTYHYLDLETGLIDTVASGISKDTTVDLYISRNEDGPFLGNIYVLPGRERALLDGIEFSEVTINDALFATFSGGATEKQFGTNTTFLIRTNDGALYKLGNAVEDLSGVMFDYALVARYQR